MIFLGIIAVILCETSFLVIKSAENDLILTGTKKLILESTAEQKNSLFSFDKAAEVGGRKKGKLFRENEAKKKLYLYFNASKKNAVLHGDTHSVFITQVNDLYTISDVDNNCLSENNGKVQSDKCRRGKKNQQWKITFYKQKDIDLEDQDKVSIDREREKRVKRGGGTEYKDSIDVYVEPSQDQSKKEHQQKKVREKKAAKDFVLVEKPRDMLTDDDKENIKEKEPPIKEKKEPKQSTRILEKPAIVREKYVAEVFTSTISTTIHTKTTETITKLDVVTEYLPQKTTTTIKIPADKILPPVVVQRVEDTSVEPSVQVEHTQASFKVNTANPKVEVREKQATLQIKQPEVQQNDIRQNGNNLVGKKNNRIVKRRKPRRVKKFNYESEPFSPSSVSLYTEEPNEEDNSSELNKKRRKKARKSNIKDGKRNKKTRNEAEKTQKPEETKGSSEKTRSKIKTHSKGKTRSKGDTKTTSSEDKNNEFSDSQSENSMKKDQNTKKVPNEIDKALSDYDSAVIKKVINEKTNKENAIFDEVKLSDFSKDLKGTHIEELIGSDEPSDESSFKMKAEKRQRKSCQQEKYTKNGVNVQPNQLLPPKPILQPILVYPTIMPQVQPQPVAQREPALQPVVQREPPRLVPQKEPPRPAPQKKVSQQPPSNSHKSHLVIKQPFKLVSETPKPSSAKKEPQQQPSDIPMPSLYPPSEDKVDNIEARFLSNKQQEDLLAPDATERLDKDKNSFNFLSSGLYSDFLGDFM
ncbi:hypothetical protein NGRA_0518 [Nosema granulosis]|uniref:Ricin B lectin n=1 Tax=Nosema granulosis TaxID=83296 RepID=A0A9P6H2W0_9MICR|nr:hypothetical protein NGRA_0518 [Nosema granulosis]